MRLSGDARIISFAAAKSEEEEEAELQTAEEKIEVPDAEEIPDEDEI